MLWNGPPPPPQRRIPAKISDPTQRIIHKEQQTPSKDAVPPTKLKTSKAAHNEARKGLKFKKPLFFDTVEPKKPCSVRSSAPRQDLEVGPLLGCNQPAAPVRGFVEGSRENSVLGCRVP